MIHSMFALLLAFDQPMDRETELHTVPFAESNCAVVSTFLAVRYYRSHVTFGDVNKAFAPEWRSAAQLVPASEIVSALQSMGISSAVVKFNSQRLADVPQGTILHCNFDMGAKGSRPHYVLFDRQEGDKVILLDPDHLTSKLSVNRDELLDKWTGQAIILYPLSPWLKVLWWLSGVQIFLIFLVLHFRRKKTIPRITAALAVCLICVLCIEGCTRPKEHVPYKVPLSAVDLGVISWDEANSIRTIDTKVPWTVKKKIVEIGTSCNCIAPSSSLVGSTLDPSAPLKIPLQLRLLNREGFIHNIISLRFEDRSRMVYNLRGFMEGAVRLSTPLVNTTIDAEEVKVVSGSLVVERLRHGSSPSLVPRNDHIKEQWLSLALVRSETVKVPADDTDGGEKYDGILDRLHWIWKVSPELNGSVAGTTEITNVSIEWIDGKLPASEVKFQRTILSPFWCPVRRVLLHNSADGKEKTGIIPLRSTKTNLADISAFIDSKPVPCTVTKILPGCWNLTVVLPATLPTNDSILEIRNGSRVVRVVIGMSLL